MSCADIVSSVGLFLDILGVILVFLFGLPSAVRKTGGTTILWAGGKSEEEAKKEYKLHWLMSHLGLVLLILGFALQLVSDTLR